MQKKTIWIATLLLAFFIILPHGAIFAAKDPGTGYKILGSGDFDGDGVEDFLIQRIGASAYAASDVLSSNSSSNVEIWYMEANSTNVRDTRSVLYHYRDSVFSDNDFYQKWRGINFSEDAWQVDEIRDIDNNATATVKDNATIPSSGTVNPTGSSTTSAPDILWFRPNNYANPGVWLMGGINGSFILDVFQKIQVPDGYVTNQ